jgi:maltose alpha-D-glucosyltransferase/alpha-amylase
MLKRPTPAWLTTAVFYEIYPQSFYDTNADGIGDLPGIIAKLDYIADLGCNAIWLNPCFVSPFGDAGYDVADFYRVAPRYGTNDDLVRLFEQAHQRGIKVCLDLVAGHTSAEHPWFKESCRHERNKYSNWYVWTDSIWDKGTPSMPMINGYAQRDGNFLSNFFYFQPALNYGFAQPDPTKTWQLPVDHPDVLAVREELKKIMRFWLDLGADGFRVDMAMSLVKSDPNLVETMKLWREVREMFDRDYPNAALMSEWSDPEKAIIGGFHVDFMLAFGNPPAYNALFRRERSRDLNPYAAKDAHSFFDADGKGNIRDFLDSYFHHYEITHDFGFITIPSGNHDSTRLAVGRTPREMLLAFAMILTMPGIPFIYYGDEIGLRQIEGLPSKEGGYSRTGARTPMQWDQSPNLGFSAADASQLYLPVDSAPDAPTVEAQLQGNDTLLAQVKDLVRLRHDNPALGSDGVFAPLYAEAHHYPFVYSREKDGQTFVITVNPSGASATADFAWSNRGNLTRVRGDKVAITLTKDRCRLEMPPLSYGIFAVAGH